MAKIDRVTVHQWAAANDAIDAVPLALLHSIIGYASLTKRTVQPDLRDSHLGARAHNLCCDLRMRRNDDSLDRLRQATQVRITRGALYFGCPRIDGIDLMARISQFSINR